MKIPSFGETKPKIRIKNTKKAVKVAKKPILREKLGVLGESSSVKTTEKRKYNVENLHPYQKGEERARKNGAVGGTVKAMNAAVLKENATVVAESGKIPHLTKKALDVAEKDPDYAKALLTVVDMAMKNVGATFDQSPDAKQKIEVDGKMDNTLNVKISEA